VNSVRLGPRRDQRADDRVRSFKPGDECVARVDRGVDGLGVGLQHGGVEHAENIEAVVGGEAVPISILSGESGESDGSPSRAHAPPPVDPPLISLSSRTDSASTRRSPGTGEPSTSADAS